MVMPFNYMNYTKLLLKLCSLNFEPSMVEDENRAKDGINFRINFAYANGLTHADIDYYISNEPCSMLEMMASLANKMEESIMYNPDKGNRTHIWFEEMLNSLDISNQDDFNFNEDYIDYRIDIFNRRLYCPNGYGGLFTIHDSMKDMREMEIWYQMQSYVNEVDKNLERIII